MGKGTVRFLLAMADALGPPSPYRCSSQLNKLMRKRAACIALACFGGFLVLLLLIFRTQYGRVSTTIRGKEFSQSKNVSANTISDMYNRLVVVTALSSNHFNESKDMIASVQKYLPKTKIILYDLGLTKDEKLSVSKYCNVEVRPVHWDRYQSYVKNLYNFAWKPLIVEEVSHETDVILYGDASLRVVSSEINVALQALLDFPFLGAAPAHGMPSISLTHDGTIDYLGYPPSRKNMSQWGQLQGGCWLMLLNSVMRERFLKNWIDCALHKECIAPKGAVVYYSECRMDDLKYKDGRYIGCHRFDQAALNVILAREFGLGLYERLGKHKVPWIVNRKVTNDYELQICK